MAMQQDVAKQIEGQIAVWQGQIKEYQERMKEAGEAAKANYEKAIATMRENSEKAAKLLNEVRQVQETAWKDMQATSQKAFEGLQKAWAEALGRVG